MITGANTSQVYFADEENPVMAVGTGGATRVSSVIQNLQKRRDTVLNGGVNCIPLPFERFRSEIPGIEQGQYVVVTANAKVGKSQFADYLYVFHVLDYVFENPDKCSAHIIYYSLEESIQRVIERYMSYLLYKLDGIRLAPSDLRSTSADFPVPQEALDKLNSPEYQERLDFFEKTVEFDTVNTNPTGILRTCEAYAKKVGKYITHKEKSAGAFSDREVEVFDDYVQDDPNHYKIVVIDHIGLVDKEQGFTTKNAIDKMSEYCVKYLRNRYNYTCVVIQQQAAESEGLEAIKQKRMTPTAATLGDSKFTIRDVNILIGLFDPSKFGLSTYKGYTINDVDGNGLKNYARFAHLLANRDGEMGSVCPLFFDGAVCHFEELPSPDDVNAVSSYYTRVKNIRTYRQQKKAASLGSLALPIFIRMTNHGN